MKYKLTGKIVGGKSSYRIVVSDAFTNNVLRVVDTTNEKYTTTFFMNKPDLIDVTLYDKVSSIQIKRICVEPKYVSDDLIELIANFNLCT